MSEIDANYYNQKIVKSDPHFCTVCNLRNTKDRSMLNYLNYRAWINYGMCQQCLSHFLGFQDGFIVNDERKNTLVKVLSQNANLKSCMNPHLRLYMFPEQLQMYQNQQIQKTKNELRIGFKDDNNLRSCFKCGFTIVLNQMNRFNSKCYKCDHPFDLQKKITWEV